MKSTVIKLFAVAAGILAGLGEKVHAAVFGHMANQGLILGMATLTPADAYTGKFPVRVMPPSADVHTCEIPFTLPATAPSVGDILQLCKIPQGVKILDWSIATDDADTSGTPTLEYALGSINAGVTDLSTVYKTAINTTETGGIQRCDSTAALLESTAAERAIGLKFTAAATTYAGSKTGSLVLKLKG